VPLQVRKAEQPEGKTRDSDQAHRPAIRRLLLVGLLVAGAYLLLPQLAGVGSGAEILQQLSPPYVAAALSLQAVGILSHAFVVRDTLRVFGGAVRLAAVIKVTLASSFATLILPSAGLSGLALRHRYFGERGCSLEATTAAFTIETVAQAAAHTAMVAVAFAHRVASGHRPPWSSLALVGSVLLLGMAFVRLALANPEQRDWRYRMLQAGNALRKRTGKPAIAEADLERRLADLRQSVASVTRAAGLRLLLGSVGRNLAPALALYLILSGLGHQVPIGSVVAGYSFSDVLGGLSTLPAGLLVGETSLSALLSGTGIPLGAAVAATLVFRLISVWVPRGFGLLAWIDLQRQSKRPLW
jgi:uncharacterized protein (TIRG00374 family)